MIFLMSLLFSLSAHAMPPEEFKACADAGSTVEIRRCEIRVVDRMLREDFGDDEAREAGEKARRECSGTDLEAALTCERDVKLDYYDWLVGP